jgi:hypothetical protein
MRQQLFLVLWLLSPHAVIAVNHVQSCTPGTDLLLIGAQLVVALAIPLLSNLLLLLQVTGLAPMM